MSLEIRPQTENDDEQALELLRAADDARVLSVDTIRHWRASRPAAARSIELVGVDGGRIVVVGGASLNLWTSTEHAAWAFLTVAADRRREGIGAAFADALLAHLHEIGARRVTTFMRQTDDGERWATARGYTRAISGPLIALDPRDVPEPELPEGLRCVPLARLTARDLYEPMCEAALDEPTPEPNDRISLEEFEREWNDPLHDLESGTAVVDGDGKVLAFAFMKRAGDRASHGFTGCVRAQRGRGLATAAKRAALRAAAARGVTRVTTSNAEENAAMRAINRRLGFEPIGEHVILAREL
ncbi:MAG TPA: GNAT family N-acetyltransferase [Gaiellaceae bacterium]